MADLWCNHTEQYWDQDMNSDWDQNNEEQYVSAPVLVRVWCESFHAVSYNPFFHVPVQVSVPAVLINHYTTRFQLRFQS